MINCINRIIVFIDNRKKVLTRGGFKENRIGMDSEIRLFLYKSYAKDYLKEVYSLDDTDYELVEVKVTYDEVLENEN